MIRLVTILFPEFETLDAFGPVEIFGCMKDSFNPQFFSRDGGIVTSSQKVPVMTGPFSEIEKPGYILLVPGGFGVVNLVRDPDYINRLKSISLNADFILSVCTGSILLSKTGLLDDRNATSNKRLFSWALKETPAVNWVKKARWVKDGNIYTSSGISAGMDMTLGFISDTMGYNTAKRQAADIEYTWNEDPAYDPFCELY